MATITPLPILRYGHPILEDKSLTIKSNVAISKLVARMTVVLYEAGGFGLAAPQVGYPLRLFLVDRDNKPFVFVNPEITESSVETAGQIEGCLSIPGIGLHIERPVKIKVKAQDQNFEPFELEADGFLARVIQHELDHLDGITIVQRAVSEHLAPHQDKLKRMKLLSGLTVKR